MAANLLSLLQVNVSPVELFLRGTAVYWTLFLTFRFIIRRDAGQVGMADLVFAVIVADASQNALAGDYKTIGEGFILISVLVFWNFLLDYAGYRFPAVARVLEAPPLKLIRNGRPLWSNMRRQFITMDELMAALRKEGIRTIDEVQGAYLESDGSFSVVRFEEGGSRAAGQSK